MSAAKRKVMACLDLRPEYARLLTTDELATNIQAVPLWMCSQKARIVITNVCRPEGLAAFRMAFKRYPCTLFFDKRRRRRSCFGLACVCVMPPWPSRTAAAYDK